MRKCKLRVGVVLAAILTAVCLWTVAPASNVLASQDGHIIYDFTNPQTIESVMPYFQATETLGTGVSDVFDAHWSVDQFGVLSRINDLGGGISSKYAELYFEKQFTNFEMKFDMKAEALDGWSGIMFNKKNLTTSFFADGDAAFFNTATGGAFFWGQSLGDAGQPGNSKEGVFVGNTWMAIRIKIFGEKTGSSYARTVEFYVDDVKILNRTVSTVESEGFVCLFTTSNATSFRNISFNYLSDKGVTLNYQAVSSVSVNNKVASGKVGESFTIESSVAPSNATNKNLVFNSDDLSTALVTPAGKVVFISPGTATITIASSDNNKITDSFTVVVTDVINKIEISNKITSAKVDDKHQLAVNILPSDLNETLVYTSSDENVATVSAQGEITFLKSGTVTIKVRGETYAGVTDSVTVTVEKADDGNGGCNSSSSNTLNGFIALTVSILLFGFAVMVIRNRRKDERGQE